MRPSSFLPSLAVSVIWLCGGCGTSSNSAANVSFEGHSGAVGVAAGGIAGSGATTAFTGSGGTAGESFDAGTNQSGGAPGTSGAPASGAKTGAGGAAMGGASTASGGVNGAGAVRASGGAGPATSTGGLGGAVASGGATSVGGQSPDAGATNPVGSHESDGKVRCGDGFCNVENQETCCVRATATGSTASCTTDPTGCPRTFACDNDGDCSGSEHCCIVYAEPGYVMNTECRPSCTTGLFECSGPSDCAGTQTCCGDETTDITGTHYTSVTCQSSCTGYPLCDQYFSCPNRTTCQPSTVLPAGFPVCR